MRYIHPTATIGEGATIGEFASIGGYAHIGEGATIGAHASGAVDIGYADEYRKCLAHVNGVAYIGAGCRWFTLADALTHWSTKRNREDTLALLASAVAIAKLRGWTHS